MDWLKRNYKSVLGTLIILILIEATVAWYLIRQFRENYLSGGQAFIAALTDSGVTDETAEAVSIDLKTKKGQAWYEVTFRLSDAPDTVYRYQVDAKTGAILSARRE